MEDFRTPVSLFISASKVGPAEAAKARLATIMRAGVQSSVGQ
jgi:hypothetical protein